jgi:hypothetical protein
MLVATRDPMEHPGPHDASSFRRDDGLRPGGAVPRVARFMTVLQLAGTLLGIPVGLASAYSIYRANFSVDTTCQTLRANIISMVDKKIDATARRMLVRHDVETFEKTCGGVDPDAEAAFKTLLAADKAPAAAAAPRAEAAQPKAVTHKVELRPSLPAKQSPAVATAATAAAAPAPRDSAVSDARWLEAVRGALVTHAPERASVPEAAAATAPAPLRPMPPGIQEPLLASRAPAPVTPAMQPVPMTVPAPVLPPATAVATVPAQRPDTDHPVPPAPIPDVASMPGGVAATPERPGASRFGWVSQIPLIGSVLAR